MIRRDLPPDSFYNPYREQYRKFADSIAERLSSARLLAADLLSHIGCFYSHNIMGYEYREYAFTALYLPKNTRTHLILGDSFIGSYGTEPPEPALEELLEATGLPASEPLEPVLERARELPRELQLPQHELTLHGIKYERVCMVQPAVPLCRLYLPCITVWSTTDLPIYYEAVSFPGSELYGREYTMYSDYSKYPLLVIEAASGVSCTISQLTPEGDRYRTDEDYSLPKSKWDNKKGATSLAVADEQERQRNETLLEELTPNEEEVHPLIHPDIMPSPSQRCRCYQDG